MSQGWSCAMCRHALEVWFPCERSLTPPLYKLDLERLPPDETLEGSDPRLVVCEQLGRGRVFIRRTGFRLSIQMRIMILDRS